MVPWSKKQHDSLKASMGVLGDGHPFSVQVNALLEYTERLEVLADAVLRGAHRDVLLVPVQEWEREL